jgi:hypothetical protein
MVNLSHISKQLKVAALSCLLTITIWLGVIPSARANNNPNLDITDSQVIPTIENSQRMQAIASCLPKQLTIQNKDTLNRISRALSEMTNDQFQRAFNLKDNPKLSDAEIEFKACLRQAGFTPKADL